MARPLRHMPYPHAVFEVTIRTIHGRFLLTPSKKLNSLILGVIGRAMSIWPEIRVYGFKVMSNHIHMYLSAPDIYILRKVMNHLDSNIAREAGRFHGWRDKFWSRRYKAAVILDDKALLEKMHYMISHGCKENLVTHPLDWPGVGCECALTKGEILKGIWYDRVAYYETARKGKDCCLSDFATEYEVPITPLPCFQGKPKEEVQKFYIDMIRDIASQTRQRIQDEKLRFVGVAGIMTQDPYDQPKDFKKSPAPLCFAASRRKRREYINAYQYFVYLYRQAAERIRNGFTDVEFPDNCFPPPVLNQTFALARSGAPPD